jgi:hypothetical protein
MSRRASLALAAAVVLSSCAAPLLKLPAVPGPAAGDASAALSEALRACRGVRTLTAQVAVSGTVNRRRLRARLQVGVAEPASAYIEAPAPFGAPLFVFAAEEDDATVFLPRDRRALEHGHPADVLEAVAGVPLGPSDLRATLTGCVSGDRRGASATAPDPRWRVFPGDDELYVHRGGATEPWRLVAVVHQRAGEAWRAEYRDFAGGGPRTIHLTSAPSPRFDLQLKLSDVETNVPLGAGTFRVQIPAGTAPLTVEELRNGGPLADRSTKSDD